MIYPDTSCLVKLYYPEPDSAAVSRAVGSAGLFYTKFHELEITAALGAKAARDEASEEQIAATIAAITEDLRADKLRAAAPDWAAVFEAATELARAHAAKTFCRALDVLHCAAAAQLNASALLSTDVRQRVLAGAIGIPVLP